MLNDSRNISSWTSLWRLLADLFLRLLRSQWLVIFTLLLFLLLCLLLGKSRICGLFDRLYRLLFLFLLFFVAFGGYRVSFRELLLRGLLFQTLICLCLLDWIRRLPRRPLSCLGSFSLAGGFSFFNAPISLTSFQGLSWGWFTQLLRASCLLNALATDAAFR